VKIRRNHRGTRPHVAALVALPGLWSFIALVGAGGTPAVAGVDHRDATAAVGASSPPGETDAEARPPATAGDGRSTVVLRDLQDRSDLIDTERTRYGIARPGAAGPTARNPVAFQDLVAAANDLLELRRTRGALMTELLELRARPFDAIAADIARVDDAYRVQRIRASQRYPALGMVLDEPGPADQEQRLAAVTGDPLDSTVDLRPLGPQVGAGVVGRVLDARERATLHVRGELAADRDPTNHNAAFAAFALGVLAIAFWRGRRPSEPAAAQSVAAAGASEAVESEDFGGQLLVEELVE